MYEVFTKYDDGYESRKSYENLNEAKSFFHNVDVQDIEFCTLSEIGAAGAEPAEIARKEPRKKPPAAPPASGA